MTTPALTVGADGANMHSPLTYNETHTERVGHRRATFRHHCLIYSL
jgi:hypothetical protein